MVETPDADISIEGYKQKERNYFVTDRPFEKNKADYAGYVDAIEEEYGGWENAKYPLGFTHDEVEELRKGDKQVLEVGPGIGVSFNQNINSGIDMYAVEPAARGAGFVEGDKTMDAINKTLMGDGDFADRVKPVRAADAAKAFPNKSFDVAYAIGPNFQSYAETGEELVEEISGVIDALSDKDSSFFAFDINEDGTVHYNIPRRDQTHTFDIQGLLDDKGIDYEVVDYFNGEHIEPSKAIRIHKRSSNGADAGAVLRETDQQELGKYAKTSEVTFHRP